jgi:hypothetical protein
VGCGVCGFGVVLLGGEKDEGYERNT